MNLNKAVRLFQIAARSGDLGSCIELAHLYREGSVGRPNTHLSLRLYLQAAKHGVSEAQYWSGHVLVERKRDFRWYDRARYWLGKAATQGHAEAQAELDRLRLRDVN